MKLAMIELKEKIADIYMNNFNMPDSFQRLSDNKYAVEIINEDLIVSQKLLSLIESLEADENGK